MTRSLRNWLASLFLLAAPGVSFGQNYVGQPHLAPIALEARCRVADGMLDSWPNFHISGADPLHVAMLSLRQNRSTPVSQSQAYAESVPAISAAHELAAANPANPASLLEVAEDSPISSFRQSADFCPFADFVQPRNLSDKPAETTAQLVGNAPPADAPSAADSRSEDPQLSAAEQKLVMRKLAKDLLAEIAADEPIDVNYLAVAQADVATTFSEGGTVGSGPVIVTLEEEYLPYDLNHRDLVSKHPVKIRILNLPAPNYCRLPPLAVLPFESDDVLLADLPGEDADAAGPRAIAESNPDSQLDLCECLPADEHREFLQDMAQPEPARFPLDCWMDELVWRASDLLREDGPIATQIDSKLLGRQFAKLTSVTFDKVISYSQPAVPILAQPLTPQQPAGQPFALPPGQRLNELAVAGSALISVAEELESLAAALRGWGSSINRVAAAKQPLVR